jgi:hypothetical protein
MRERSRIDGHDTVPVPVNRRPVGVVFQSYALFPHLTVARNVAYGLRMRGMKARNIGPRVAAALAAVSLTGFENRYPAQLSEQPLRIINTPWAVVIGMVQVHLPVMILPLIAVMSRHDRKLDEASAPVRRWSSPSATPPSWCRSFWAAATTLTPPP